MEFTMIFSRVIFGLLLLSAVGAAQQYAISTYAGGATPATPAPPVSGSIGAPMSVATDAMGNAYFASPELSSVFKLDPAGVLTRVAGNGMLGYSGDGGPATSARLHLAFANSASVAVDNAGNLFIADATNHRVRRVSANGIIATVAGNGYRGFSGDGGAAIDARLNYPWGVAVDDAGNLFILDAHNYLIRKVAANGVITTFAGGGRLAGSAGDNGPATSAQMNAWGAATDRAGNLFIVDAVPYEGLNGPSLSQRTVRKISPTGTISTVAQGNAWSSVAVDGSGNLFLAEYSGSIRKVAPDGSTLTVAGTGTVGFSGDGGPATRAQLSTAIGAAVDGAGNLFIADTVNGRVRKVSPSGIISTVAGDGTSYYNPASSTPANDGKPAISVRLDGPWGVATDRAGNVFLTDANRVRKVAPGGIITTVAGNGTTGFSGDGGPATSAQLSAPIGVAVDRAGNLFILESGETGASRVRKVSPAGIISTVAGNGKTGFSGDGGPATSAQLGSSNTCNRSCGGLAVDAVGNLFVADSENGRVRKVDLTGIITTVAGNGAHEYPGVSGDGGPATDALIYPVGVTVDGAGNLFIAENARVRKVDPRGIITTIAGGGQLAGSSGDGGQATNARLSNPYALALDGAGNLLIADPGWNFFTGDAGDDPADHRIRRVSPSGIITTVVGVGAAGFSGDGGPASTAALNAPLGVAVDEAGNVYVADSGNRVVRILRPVPVSVLIGAVVDAASQRADAIAPGKIVVIYGAGLGPSQLIQNQPGNGVLSKALAGTVVAFNGIAAPLLYTSATQIAAIMPYSLTGTPAQVTVTYQGQDSVTYAIPVAASAPSLFTVNQSGWGQAAAINTVEGTVNTAANPVKIGGYVSLYATGEGQTAPAGADGSVAGSTGTGPVLSVTVTIGGMPATVQYAGSAPGQVAGLMQVNVQIPSGVQPGGYVPVVLQVGDRSSSPAVWIAVAN